MKSKFVYNGKTPAYGDIFKKGKVHITVYYTGLKRYFPFGCPGPCWERDKTGMIHRDF